MFQWALNLKTYGHIFKSLKLTNTITISNTPNLWNEWFFKRLGSVKRKKYQKLGSCGWKDENWPMKVKNFETGNQIFQKLETNELCSKARKWRKNVQKVEANEHFFKSLNLFKKWKAQNVQKLENEISKAQSWRKMIFLKLKTVKYFQQLEIIP